MPVILDTREAEMGRITVSNQPRQKFYEILVQQKTLSFVEHTYHPVMVRSIKQEDHSPG
jgi:hypothetical protein